MSTTAPVQIVFDHAMAATYVIHVGGDMMDDHGNAPNFERHGPSMGGQWATGSMMMGPGGQGDGTHWARAGSIPRTGATA